MPDASRPLFRRRLLSVGLAGTCAAVLLALSRRLQGAARPAASEKASMAETLPTISLGDPGNTHLQGPDAQVEHHPTGMNFYKRSWPTDRLGRVRYLQGSHSFDLSGVAEVMGSCDRDTPQTGIYVWDISTFPTDAPTIPHEQARDALFCLFATLQRAGWRRFVEFSEPRLRGLQSLRYASTRVGDYPLDPDYLPDMDQWMRIVGHMPYWRFWADGSFLMLRLMDEPALRSLKRDGVYMFSIDITNESYHFEQYFADSEKRLKWAAFVEAEIADRHKDRARIEAQLQAQGCTIDTSYTDPPILALRHRG